MHFANVVTVNQNIPEETTHGQHQYFSYAKTCGILQGYGFLNPRMMALSRTSKASMYDETSLITVMCVGAVPSQGLT